MSKYVFFITVRKYLVAAVLFSLAGLTPAGPAKANGPDQKEEGLVLSADYEYSGETVDMKPSGYGTAIYKDGSKYMGHWADGVWNGLGKLVSPEGEVAFGIFRDGKQENKPSFPVGELVYGIDVSKYQGQIDWEKVCLPADENGTVSAEGGDFLQPAYFALIKATDGKDPSEGYDRNYAGAKKCGMVCGAYHFLTTLSPVDTQVEQFIKTAHLEPGDLPPVLDLEIPDKVMKEKKELVCEMAIEWLEKIEAHYGVTPIVYTFNNFIADYLSDPRFDKYVFWVSRFGEVPPDVRDWKFWQFSDKARIPGIKASPVDLNIFDGNLHDFLHYVEHNGIK